MPQEYKENEAVIYKVKASYYVIDIDKEGRATEVPLKDQDIALYKLQRRNKAHSDVALKVLYNEPQIDIAAAFIAACVVDEKIKQDLLCDSFAMLDIINREEVSEDFARFFENADYVKRMEKKVRSKIESYDTENPTHY